MIGKMLGTYPISNQPGKGLMGEVSQAEDRKPGCCVPVRSFFLCWWQFY